MSAPTTLESSGTPTAGSSPTIPPNGKSTLVKLVLLGESAVGKSSLVLRLVKKDFDDANMPTIGAAFMSQNCQIKDGRTVKFEIWDTAGQERFHSLAPMYYRKAQAAIVVYDVTKAATLDKAKSWIKELQRQANSDIVIALAGNKIDLVENNDMEDGAIETEESSNTNSPKERREVPRREVSTEEARTYAEEACVLFFETSAKEKINIDEMFEEIAMKIPLEDTTRASNSRNLNSRIDLTSNRGVDRSSGCAC